MTMFHRPVFSLSFLRSLMLSLALLALCLRAESQKLTRYVNPFVGTDGHGHTFPGATMPFGMVQLSPDTRVEGWDACGGYHYSDSTMLGFSHTHLSGTGVADYGDILLLPITGKLTRTKGLQASFRHTGEIASPGYYSVTLNGGAVKAELTATERVGVHRYRFAPDEPGNVVINLQHGLGPDKVIASEITIVNDYEITGVRRSAGWARDQHVYFVAQFSIPFTSYVISSGDTLQPGTRTASGTDLQACAQYTDPLAEPLIVKVGISAVSVAGARRNLEKEMPEWDFDTVRLRAEAAWERELGKIFVEGGTEKQFKTFYTALYHAMIAPNLFSDVDGAYSGMDDSIHVAEGFDMYSVFSLWDTFRAEHPLLTIIDRKRTLDFIRSLLAKYEESTVLPVWELAANETWCMIGYHAVPVIVDAYMKGIRDFDVEKAYAAMKHSAMLDHFGLSFYREHGYIPGELEAESVSKTLEYSYDDWCIALMARELGNSVDEKLFTRRSQYYRNVYDRTSGFMRAKENGAWVEPFDPSSVSVHYTEANAWQYSFFAPQDIGGLIELMGGKEAFTRKLDTLFEGSSGLSGRQQADITGLIGQYAQGNEPSHHVAYLYNHAGAPWKTQAITRRIMDSLFTSRPDGLCGNDDCGQMSAWYVMSALGLYQVTPGQPLYSIGSPLFRNATVTLENGKQFMLTADNNSSANRYIQSARMNGSPWEHSFIGHEAVMNGATLAITMGPHPNRAWASSVEHTPRSAPMLTVPTLASTSGKAFLDSTRVAISSDNPGADIYYSFTTGDAPVKYTAPLLLRETGTITAFASLGGERSEPVRATFTKRKPTGAITLASPYSIQYTGGGDDALIDGIRGAANFRLGAWQGFEQNDLDALIDLETTHTISSVSVSCLQDAGSWIFFPTDVEFSFSTDGKTYSAPVKVTNTVSPDDENIQIHAFGTPVKEQQARYVRVRAKNIGTCPPGHRGAGGKAWLFADEILINAGQ